MFYLIHRRIQCGFAAAALATLFAEPAWCGGRDRILAAIATPSSALLLLGCGILGVCGELAYTGLFVPGVLGAVCILLSLNSPAAAAFDLRGVALLAAALCLLALEAFRRAHGLLTAAGACLAVAGLILLRAGIAWPVALAAAALFAPLIAFLLSVAVAARRNKLAILEKGDRSAS
jgi:membrane-bound serine protease (ClpP class)